MNRLLFRFWFVTLILFGLLTFFYLRSNAEFEETIRPKLGKSLYVDLIRVHPQVFTPTMSDILGKDLKGKIGAGLGSQWHKLLNEDPEIRHPYHRSFQLDNIWAFFLCLLVYTLSFAPVGKSRVWPYLLGILFLAYGCDFCENSLYTGNQKGYTSIPLVCSLKMFFYILGIALAITSFVGNVRSLSPKPSESN